MPDIIMPTSGRPYLTIQATSEVSPLDLSAETVIAQYKLHGALLLRGFLTDVDVFGRFTQQFCASSVFNESPGRQLLDDSNNIQTVDGGLEAFPLHPELSREPWKPDICFFACLNPPRELGATTVCDGVEIVRHLPPALRDELAHRRLLYMQPAAPEILAYWLGTATPSDAQLNAPPPSCPYAFRRIGAQIVRTFTRPVLHTPMFTAEPAFGNFLLFARYMLGLPHFPVFEDGTSVPDSWMRAIKQIGDELTAAVTWQRGDILMLDNTRFMHGRTAIAAGDGRLIASYFGYLNFALPNAEEPVDPPWRRGSFRPPQRRIPAAA